MAFNKQAVGTTICRLRTPKNMSQELLSALAGIARTHLTMIETGTKQPNLETVWRIATALEMQPSVLVAEIEKECKQSIPPV